MKNREEQKRIQLMTAARNIVVKVGTRVLTNKGRVDYEQLSKLVHQLHELSSQDRRVTLVSSGAVGTAMTLLDSDRPKGLGDLQAFAAIGQAELIHLYNKEFTKFGRYAAQVLLTADDMNHRKRYLNLRNTFFALFELGATPIVNENDCVATDEIAITFGDNDRLAATVAMLVDADLLIILSDVDSLYNRHPSDPAAKRISFVESIDESVANLAFDSTGLGSDGQFSKGGMSSKISAAKMATSAGIPAIVAGGRVENILPKLLSAESHGTLFGSVQPSMSSWKRWLKSSTEAMGKLLVDEGAIQAIHENGKSLLPIGVKKISGDFQKGDLVLIGGPNGNVVAHGVSNYSSTDAAKICGQHSERIAECLGRNADSELVHRNNLVLV